MVYQIHCSGMVLLRHTYIQKSNVQVSILEVTRYPARSPATADSGSITLSAFKLASRRQTHQRVLTAPFRKVTVEPKRRQAPGVVLSRPGLENASPHHCRALQSALGMSLFFKWLKQIPDRVRKLFSPAAKNAGQGARLFTL